MNLLTDNFFRQLVSRAVRTDYLENVTGFAWLLIQPLMLLAIYTFVFTTIFKARIPDSAGIGFVPYLAVAFWPWTAFSEAVLKASGSISANAALIGKVSIPTEMIPLSTVTATFGMNLAGYAAVLLVLALFGTPLQWVGILPAIPLLALLFLLGRSLSRLRPPLRTAVPWAAAALAAVYLLLVIPHDARLTLAALQADRNRGMISMMNRPCRLRCVAFFMIISHKRSRQGPA